MAAPSTRRRARSGALVALATAGMAFSLLLLFVMGALGPFLVHDLALSRSQLGSLVTAAFGVATVLSLASGHAVDLAGARRALAVLLALVAADLVLLSLAPAYGALLAAAALGGVAQSLANPATNKLVAAHVSSGRRAVTIGIKQSGVQVGAFAAGLLLPPLAAAAGWRAALRVAAVVPFAAFLLALLALPAGSAAETAGRARLPSPPRATVRWLMVYSTCLGGGIAATNTYLPLYAHERLGVQAAAAGAVLAAVGLSGIVSRVCWTQVSSRMRDPVLALAGLAATAACFGLVAWLAERGGIALLWVGALGLGASAVAAHAVSMLIVVNETRLQATGHASALVALGFFAGFAVSAPAFGALVDASRSYTPGWLLVAGLFAAAAVLAFGWRRGRRVHLATARSS